MKTNFFVILILIFSSMEISIAENHSGTISGSETWYAARSPHLISGALTIAFGGSVTVQAGSTIIVGANVMIQSGGTMTINNSCDVIVHGHYYEDPIGSGWFTYESYYFDVDGTFDASGSSGNEITFTGHGDEVWWGIRFTSGARDCNLAYCLIEKTLKTNTSSYSVTSTYCGGAVWINGTSAEVDIDHCEFQDNEASSGAAIFCNNVSTSNITITNNIFHDNTAYDGGAIGLYYGDCKVHLNKFYNNSADNYGGSMYLSYGSDPEIYNDLFYDNSAGNGGAIYVVDSDPEIYNCTISDNSASSGGGVYYTGNSPLDFRNTILYFNTSDQVSPDPNNNSGIYAFCDIYGINFSSNGNKNGDPQFVNSGTGDYRISNIYGSACENWGDDQLTVGYTSVDLKGDTRIISSRVDIGAYEYENPSPDYKLAEQSTTTNLVDNIDFEVFPNPATLYTSLIINSDENSEYRICLFNNIGEVVYNETLNGTGSELYHLIDLTKFVNGMYIIKVTEFANELNMCKLSKIVIE